MRMSSVRPKAALAVVWVAVITFEILASVGAVAVPIDGGTEVPPPDVFYNFYVPPVNAENYPGAGTQLYVSPRPVPPRMGHTWNTYPPLMPHVFLYKHKRRYIRPAGATGFQTNVRAYWY